MPRIMSAVCRNAASRPPICARSIARTRGACCRVGASKPREEAMARLRGLLIPVLLVALWEIGARAGTLPPDTMSQPSLILAAGWEALSDGTLLLATWQTFQTALLGLALGAAIGISIGSVIGLFPALEAVVGPTLDTI